MASGSQKWKGICAALEKPAIAISTAVTPVSTALFPQLGFARMSANWVEPVTPTMMPSAAMRNRPPTKVRIRVRVEPAWPELPERAMRKKEASETSSQPMNSRATSLARTSSSTASMKAVISR